MKKHLFFLLLLPFILGACKHKYDLPKKHTPNKNWLTKTIAPYPQTPLGNPDSGFYYLINGGYTGSGLPYEMIEKRLKKLDKWVEKKWLITPYAISNYATENGTRVLSGTCFSCHAGEVNGKVILGIGNSENSNQYGLKNGVKFVNWRVKRRYRKDSLTLDAYEDFGKYLTAMAPNIQTNNPVVNPAARIAESCMRYRNPVDLTYDTVQYKIRSYNLASDTPALWHLKKKNALYYTAVGRGDFTKLLFQASVLGIRDSTAARKTQQSFTHIIAWISKLNPPKYPKEIDSGKAQVGKIIFEKHCSNCHGTYGSNETYPNKVVNLEVIKTDPVYAEYASEGEIVAWYNKSWFSQSKPYSWFEPEQGYIAPPLDGIWATAPYLHNGSIPTIYDVLNSTTRPKYWERFKDSEKYDWQKIGWEYKSKSLDTGKKTYNTTLPGYGNEGHYFGDKLTETQRMQIIEYLKTL